MRGCCFTGRQCLQALGRTAQARDCAAAAQERAPPDPALLDAIGGLLSQCSDQQRALAAYDRAVALSPGDPHFLFNRAAVYRFLGRLAEAEADYDRVIALQPADHEAYKNRSDLRTQSPDINHVQELEALLAKGITDWGGQVQIRFALAKEYEDVGDFEKSFVHLRRCAALRREHLRYDVAADVATVDWIMEAFPAMSNAPPQGTWNRRPRMHPYSSLVCRAAAVLWSIEFWAAIQWFTAPANSNTSHAASLPRCAAAAANPRWPAASSSRVLRSWISRLSGATTSRGWARGRLTACVSPIKCR